MPASAPAPFFISLCADDYGLTPAINAGILDLIEAKRLDAVSVMTHQNDWQKEGARLRGAAATIDLGVHLTLTLGNSLTSMPQIAPHGTFPSLSSLLLRSLTRRLPLKEIRQEIQAQLDQFESILGHSPHYIDGHEHIHILPGIRQELLSVLQSRGWTGKIWIRNSGDKFSRILTRRTYFSKALGVALLAQGFEHQIKKAGFLCNEGFSGFSSFSPLYSYQTDFCSYFICPGPFHLIMCHPGRLDSDPQSIEKSMKNRSQEYRFFLSGEADRLLQAHHIHRTRLSFRLLSPAAFTSF